MRSRFRVSLAFVVLALTASTHVPGTTASAQAESRRWIVIFNQPSSIPADAAEAVADAGGEILATLPEIGALVASSSQPRFATWIARNPRVSEVGEDVLMPMIPSPTALNLRDASELETMAEGAVEAPGSDAQTGSEPFYPFQWDKKRMRASNQGSYAVQQGRPDVVVAVLDTGAQILPTPHPDIVPNLDVARSRSFVPVASNPNGDPNPAAWDDKNGHGSWCLSAVGAPINGIGMSGVAPRVRLVALKVMNDAGEGSVVSIAQALIYTGINQFDIASMSFGVYTRHADGNQIAITLLQRAVNFARSRGVTPIAALGNESFDISDGNLFRDFVVLPAELPGVIGVSATGFFNQKASYSNYGVGKTDVSAPGGDTFVQTTSTLVGSGGALGAWAPDNTQIPGAQYVFASGTSMAAPNAAGVAALIISQYGDFTPQGNKNHMSPQAVESILQQTANNRPCPEPREVTYVLAIGFPGFPAGTPVPDVLQNQRCDGDAGYNNFFGKGMVDALKAVTR